MKVLLAIPFRTASGKRPIEPVLGFIDFKSEK